MPLPVRLLRRTGNSIRIHVICSDKDISVVLHAALQTFQYLRSCALLRAKGVSSSIFSTEGIGDVAHDGKDCVCDPRVQAAVVYRSQASQIGTVSHKLPPRPVKEADAQRAHAAHAAVVGGGAADGDGDITEASVEGVTDQFASSVGACIQGISLFLQVPGRSPKPGPSR